MSVHHPAESLRELKPTRYALYTVEEDDLEALSHITDLTVEYSSEDPRDYSVIFTFDGKNPYFKETELKKSFTVHEAIKKSTPYDLDAPVFTEKVAIR